MAAREFTFKYIKLEEDTIYIPVCTDILKFLHRILPTVFLPFILKPFLYFSLVILFAGIASKLISWLSGTVEEANNRLISLYSGM